MFSTRLRQARNKKDLTLEEVAEIYNDRFDGKLTKGTLSKYENGTQEPLTSVTVKLAAVLGVSVDWLTGADADRASAMSMEELKATLSTFVRRAAKGDVGSDAETEILPAVVKLLRDMLGHHDVIEY